MTLIAGAVAVLFAGSAFAGDAKVVIDDKNPVPAPEPWSVCKLFDYSTLYESDQGFIDKIALTGRYHGQWHNTDANQGEDAGWENRRWRAGAKIEFLDDFTLFGEFNLNPDEDRFVQDVEEVTLEWAKDETYIIVGKQKPKITREWSTSSRLIKTIERSQLVNQLTPEKLGGVVAGYHFTEALWAELGGYTGAWTDDWAMPDFNGGYAMSARIGYDVTENTEARFDYFYADQDPESDAVEPYDNIFSWNTESHWDAIGLYTDIIYGTGTDNKNHGDVFGIVLMPTYALTDKLEAVFRYTYSTSDSPTGIRLQSRYERPAADLNQRGSDYNAFYLGLNYYICKDKLKLMTGVEYSTLGAPAVGSGHDKQSGDYDGWTYFAGVRLYY